MKFGFSSFITVALIAIPTFILAIAQVEAPPVKDECQWMYYKALNAALGADKSWAGVRGWIESNNADGERSTMWSQLYMACKAKVRR